MAQGTGVVKYATEVPVEFYQWAPLVADSRRDQRSAYVRSVIAPKANDQEWGGFCEIANAFRLNPLQNPRPIWLVPYEEGMPMTTQIGIAGYRIFAERSGRYAGSVSPEWAGQPKDEDAPIAWRQAWLFDNPPAVARAGAFTIGAREPTWGIATFREFAKWTTDRRSGQKRLRSLWATYPSLMLGKCAEKQALCRAFPEQLAEPERLHLFSEGDAPRISEERYQAAYQPRTLVNGVALPQLATRQAASVNDLFDPRVMDQTEPVAVQTAPPTQPPAAGGGPAAGGSAAGSTSAAAQQRSEEIARQTGHQGDPTSFWKLSRKYGLSQQTVGEKLGVGSMLAWLNADKTRTWADAEAALRAVMGPLPGEEPAAPPQPATAPGGNGITEDQAVRLTQLAEGKHGLDHYGTRAVCLGLFDSKPRELTAEQADQLITYLEQAEPVDIALAFGNGAELREAEAAQEIAADAEAALEDPAAARAAQA